MTVSGELCCVALPFICVVVALPFSASLEGLFTYYRVGSISTGLIEYKCAFSHYGRHGVLHDGLKLCIVVTQQPSNWDMSDYTLITVRRTASLSQ